MFKRSFDNCRKAIKPDYVGVDFNIDGKFDRYDFCVSCIKSIPVFLKKMMRKKGNKK